MRNLHPDTRETLSMLGFLALVLAGFAAFAPQVLGPVALRSMAFQLPELGLLTLAMFIPIVAGGLNLAVTYTANAAGLIAAVLMTQVMPDAGGAGIALAMIAALLAGAAIGAAIGAMIAWVEAHPILVTLGAMILLRGVGEFATRGGDISGMPPVLEVVGHGSLLGLPVPLLIFAAAVALWVWIMRYTRLGYRIHMVGSNPAAATFSGIDTRRVLVAVYALSGFMAALAGLMMLARFNSVRVGHGESYLLMTILACFLAGADPFGGFGRVVPLAIALVSLQLIASGMNVLGANQHLVTAVWGGFLIIVMIGRTSLLRRR
ncbi:ABC transporter permease [Paracoccus sp. p4-l81]|uniref:ABC transporter permease n=1 Tax=Paracoccus sp. p4-l81 TaxID=3342806 RepID=UPI0035B8A13D